MIRTNRSSAAVALACAGFALASTAGAVDLRDWGKKYPASERFVVLAAFDNQAVLDKETQLVWERSARGRVPYAVDWDLARVDCFNRILAGRKGWRLPSVHELNTLIVPNFGLPKPQLPDGHPFTDIAIGSGDTNGYWSATTNEGYPQNAFYIRFSDGFVYDVTKDAQRRAWCVRGGPASTDRY